jgi:hypothetical protein
MVDDKLPPSKPKRKKRPATKKGYEKEGNLLLPKKFQQYGAVELRNAVANIIEAVEADIEGFLIVVADKEGTNTYSFCATDTVVELRLAKCAHRLIQDSLAR